MSSSNESTFLKVLPYEWVTKNPYTDKNGVSRNAFTDDGSISIHAWCLDKDSVPHLLRIEDFPLLCYIELPRNVYGKAYKWTEYNVNKVVDYLNFRLKDHSPIGHALRYLKKTYYYKGEVTYPMLMLKFKNYQSMSHCKNLIKYPLKTRDLGTLRCKMWENDIPIVRKLLTNQGLSFSQWMICDVEPVEEENKISYLKNEYYLKWASITKIPPEECDTYKVHPKIMAFDIECYSDDKRVFPNEWRAKHVAYMISCICQRYQHVSTRKRYAIILGPCAEIPSSKLKNTEIIHVDSENELVEEFGKLMIRTDPDMITGYNIFKFDYKYLHNRLVQKLKEWPVMGRLYDEKAVMEKQEWSSGGYGHNIIYDLKMDGRINIDLLPVIKRDHKLLKYTLDFVAETFLGAHKHNITAADMFWIYEELQDSESHFKRMCNPENVNELGEIVVLLEKVFEECLWQDKSKVFDLYKDHANISTTHYKRYLKGWNGDYPHDFVDLKRVFDILQSHNDIFEKHGVDVHVLLRYVLAMVLMTFVLLYCIQDSELVLDLIEELNIIVGLVEMSRVCGVTIVELFTRGQQIRCMSLLYDIAAKQGFVIDKAAKPGYSYKGGYVYPPTPGLHDNVMCWDFSSLYPTIIMAYNIDYTTLVDESIEHLVPDELCNVIVFEQEEEIIVPPEKEEDPPTKKLVTKQYRFKFLNADKTGKRGLLPQLEREMVTERRAVRAKGKKEKNPLMKVVYHQRQLALKVVCNSFYGFLGVKNNGKMPLIEGAMSITGKARESILTVSSYISEKHGGTVIYGDSVTGDTPIICKIGNDIFIRSISQLYDIIANDSVTLESEDGKEHINPRADIQVWSDKGFTNVKCVMRHRTKKRIYRITAHTGVVKVTEDHSLLNSHGDVVKPCNVNIGDKLLVKSLEDIVDNSSGKEYDEAWSWGLFYGDGSCEGRMCSSGVKWFWTIKNENVDYLNKAKTMLEKVYPSLSFVINKVREYSNVHTLTPKNGDVYKFVIEWRELFYNGETGCKNVPDRLWSSSKSTRESFYSGYYASDEYIHRKNNCIAHKGQIGSAGLFLLARSLGYKVSCNTRRDNSDVNITTFTKRSHCDEHHPGLVKKIEDLGLLCDYVYDLETENHHFSAGVGEIVVHNTDSVMATMGTKDPMETIKLGKILEKELSDLFPDPMEMELEKVMRMLSLKKKRYVYAELDWETGELKLDPSDLNFKGIELARRDRPKWLTDLQLKVILKILHLRPFEEALEVVFDEIDRLLSGNVDYKELITVKGLNSSYKSKSAEMAVFADELKKIGKPAQPGSRLDFLVVEAPKGTLKGRRMRLPETYLERLGTEEEEKIDYMYYLDKLQNPIGQLLTIAYKETVEKLSDIQFRPTRRHKFVGFDDPILLFSRMIRNNQDYHILKDAVHDILNRTRKTPTKRPRLVIHRKGS